MVAAWSSCCFQRHQLTRLMVVLQKAASFSSMESFSPTLPLAHAHPKAALGILIFILMLPFQSLLLLKTFFNLNFNNAFHRTLQWLPSLPVLYKPVLPFPCALAAADKRFSSLHCQSHSSVLNPVRLFINHYFESSNDHRAVCVLPSQARALQSAPTCVLLTWALPHFQSVPASSRGSVCTLGRTLPARKCSELRIGVKSQLHMEMGCKYALPKQDTIWIFLQVIITLVTFLGK